MDFVDGLPMSRGKNTNMVVIDKLTKHGHFLALAHPFTALIMIQDYLNQVYKLHGVLRSIVSNRDKVFLNHF